MRALISGATGLIGSAFMDKYDSKFQEIYTLGRHPSNSLNHIQFDLSDPQNIPLPDFDVFFHFAAQTSSHGSEVDVLNDLKTNILGLTFLLELFKGFNIQPIVILASTATQVGFTNEKDEHDFSAPDNPITFYDLSKLTAEKYLLRYVEHQWISGCSLRLCNVFGGAREYGAQDRGIIDKMFTKALNGEKITLYGEGNYLRDYIYIEDVIDAFWQAFICIKNTNGKIFYIGSGKAITLKDAFLLTQKIASEVNPNQQTLDSVPSPSTSSLMESRSFIADNSSFVKATSWVPQYDLEQGLRHCYKNVLLDL